MGKSGKDDRAASAGTPAKSDREVIKRARPVSAEAPEVTGVEGGEKIKPVDLSLHGDGVTHWQDEPLSERRERRKQHGEIPSDGKEKE